MVQKAVKASKASNKNGHKKLRFEGTTDGVIVPLIMDDEVVHAPLDFTSITSREVGRQHSQWAVRHAHLIYLIGVVQAELGNVKYDLKNAEARWMLRHKGEFKNKWEAEHAASASKKIRLLRRKVIKAQNALTKYESLATSYQSLMQAASREIARRSEERNTRD
jgi:hypothetical protein